MKTLISTAWRFALANTRNVSFRLILIGIIIGVTALTSIGFVTSRINQHLIGEANVQLGGDAILTASYPFFDTLTPTLNSEEIPYSINYSFRTMAAAGDEFELAAIRAVDNSYPLLGSIEVEQPSKTTETALKGPQPGEIWPEQRLLDELNIQVGDSIEIGYATLKVTGVLVRDSGQRGGFYSMQPRGLMALSDIDKTQVIQPGSRVRYQLNLVDNNHKLEDWFNATPIPEDIEVTRVTDGNNALSSALTQAARYFGIANLLTIILTGITIAIAALTFSYRELPTIALLGCLGMSRKDIRTLVALELGIVAVIAAIIGIILGYLVHLGLVQILSSMVQGVLPPPTIAPIFMGFAVALFFTLGFSAVPILRIASTPPLRILRNEITTQSGVFKLGLGLGVVSILALLWLQTGDIELTLIVAGTALMILGIMISLLRFGIRAIKPERVSPEFKSAMGRLHRTPWLNALQITAFALVGASLGLTLLFNFDAMNQWRAQIPSETPNRFAFNLQQDDTVKVNTILEKYGLEAPEYYPVVRARLTHIDDIAVIDAVTKETAQREDALQRDLSLTFSSLLPPDNEILEGQWWGDEQPSNKSVSVEESVATNLGLTIGSRLTFSAGSRQFSATVSSIRSVEWGNFKPNFYMIFRPGDLDGFATNWLTAFYLPNAQQAEKEIRQTIPAVTLVDVDSLLSQARDIIDKVAQSISSILVMTFSASIILFITALVASTDERTRESAIIRILGAPRSSLRNRLLIEFGTIGAISGVLASIIVLISGNLLYHRLEINALVPFKYWGFWPIILAVILAFAGYRFANRIASQPPLATLRGQ